uniref:C2H2-type domain-containing protein n=1 Tax=Aplanochytrium stocchinoi TaxID=215587 RepID=A0A7S3PI74_9STRA|mmetsp:Transcript_8485/g.9993  ORF Transcript_8485/g.9993 Transcript_8485/m.9993 type:complete len:451 (+) Transcript_8485:179-1531(+)
MATEIDARAASSGKMLALNKEQLLTEPIDEAWRNSKRSFVCDNCGKILNSQRAMDYHQKQNVCEKQKVIDEKKRKKEERALARKDKKEAARLRKEERKRGLKRKRDGKKTKGKKKQKLERTIPCKTCGKMLASQGALKYHLKQNVCKKIQLKAEEKKKLQLVPVTELPSGKPGQKEITLAGFAKATTYLNNIVNPDNAAKRKFSAKLSVSQMKEIRMMDAYSKHLDLNSNNRVKASMIACVSIYGKTSDKSSRARRLRKSFETLCDTGKISFSQRGKPAQERSMINVPGFREEAMKSLKKWKPLTCKKAEELMQEVVQKQTNRIAPMCPQTCRRWLKDLGFQAKFLDQQWIYVLAEEHEAGIARRSLVYQPNFRDEVKESLVSQEVITKEKADEIMQQAVMKHDRKAAPLCETTVRRWMRRLGFKCDRRTHQWIPMDQDDAEDIFPQIMN